MKFSWSSAYCTQRFSRQGKVHVKRRLFRRHGEHNNFTCLRTWRTTSAQEDGKGVPRETKYSNKKFTKEPLPSNLRWSILLYTSFFQSCQTSLPAPCPNPKASLLTTSTASSWWQ